VAEQVGHRRGAFGWRWPWHKTFREKNWLRYEPMPLAIYGPMDMVYLTRAANELQMQNPIFGTMSYIGPTIRAIIQSKPACGHNYWIASCQHCARAALLLAVSLKAKSDGRGDEECRVATHWRNKRIDNLNLD